MSVIKKLTHFNELMLSSLVHEGMTVIDCTVGNGNDALTLLRRVGSSGFLYGFDIQSMAIDATRRVLEANGYSNYQLTMKSHACLEDSFSPETVDCIVYNLGYLPGADKSVTTHCEDTLASVTQGLKILKPGGVMSISVYVGHSAGEEEGLVLDKLLKEIDPKRFHVMKTCYANQSVSAPYVYWIEKK